MRLLHTAVRFPSWVVCTVVLVGALAPALSPALQDDACKGWTEACAASGAERVRVDGGMDRLVDLAVMRLNLADAIAASKWQSGKAIEDLPRERILLMRVHDDAPRHHVSADFAALFFADQIAASKTVQFGLMEQWRKVGGPNPNDAPKLDMLRDRLDLLTQQLLGALGDVEPLRAMAACQAQLDLSLAAARQHHAFDVLHESGLRQALHQVCADGKERSTTVAPAVQGRVGKSTPAGVTPANGP